MDEGGTAAVPWAEMTPSMEKAHPVAASFGDFLAAVEAVVAVLTVV